MKAYSVGTHVRFHRPMQQRIMEGHIIKVLMSEEAGAKQEHYLVDFGAREFLELCVASLDDGFLEVTASGMRIEVV